MDEMTEEESSYRFGTGTQVRCTVRRWLRAIEESIANNRNDLFMISGNGGRFYYMKGYHQSDHEVLFNICIPVEKVKEDSMGWKVRSGHGRRELRMSMLRGAIVSTEIMN